jgi:para-aminobenzoate synthetase / 4-amino-4-deoxychorismate lyase
MIILDFPGASRRVFRAPVAVLQAETPGDVPGVLAEAEAAGTRGLYAVGYVSYEAAPAFDRALRVCDGARMPLAWFGLFEGFTQASGATPMAAAVDWSIPERSRFVQSVARIREEIAAGRTYQVNLTARLTAQLDADPLALYESLRRAQGIGYHACLDIGDFIILSASPELFFELRGRRIRTRPMKGTRARGRFNEEDERAARELAASEKDRAENLMIVDLLRNDLGRVAETGSVEVTSLFDVEQYRTVFQMTSVIEADLAEKITLGDVFGALFPCGSVTGAPKISTMQLIAELEAAPREVYCGAIGVIEPGGDATFNVPIRTVWMDKAERRAVYGTGAGITFDSDPAAEYDEIVAKSAVLTEEWPDFDLIETLRMEDFELVRLERHVARVLDSARYFGIAVDESDIRAALASTLGPGRARVRLLVDQGGMARAEALPYDDAQPARIALAGLPVQSSDRFLFHKTTHRRVYDERRADHWDVLLWNERDELTEFTRGNVVLELDGQLLTPARECGLLAGTFRAELLENSTIREAVIGVKDLERATRVWLINSLREMVLVDQSGLVRRS